MSFEWNNTINELYNKETKQALEELSVIDQELGRYDEKILDDTVIIKYHVHITGEEDDTFNLEIIDKIVEWSNQDKYYSYDEEGVSCWETLDMYGFIRDNFGVKVDDVVVFKVELKFHYDEDYYGEVDVQVEETLIHGMIKRGE